MLVETHCETEGLGAAIHAPGAARPLEKLVAVMGSNCRCK